MTPEDRARENIDRLLHAAGWTLQDKDDFNRKAAVGVARRHFQMGSEEADYLLFIDGKAVGVIEAKREGVTLGGVADQSERYRQALPSHILAWGDKLLFNYESTGAETFFADMRDPKPRSRRIFAFHKPETLLAWAKSEASLRARMSDSWPLDASGLRDCQTEAIKGLEASLRQDRPRALIQMATGAGKTFTACSFSWRLLKHAGARRILFLVDRTNLGTQTLKEFQNFEPPGAANKFTEVYVTQALRSAGLDPDARVVITTIQRVYAMLRGEAFDDAEETRSAFEVEDRRPGDIKPIAYNPDLPIEAFDVIVVDECHRSIYNAWRQVFDYFDAHVVGLTATPGAHTLGFFNKNLVSEYPYERSVADGVNVGYEVFCIRTEIGEQGGTLPSGYTVPVRDKKTRAARYRNLDEALDYTRRDLDRSVTAENQIRTVLECYRDSLFTELFPGRTGEWVPKTLIFAKDDNHAEEITRIAREVFGEGNDFAKKITYRSDEDANTLIKAFRVDPFPRIAVTVDMIATGTDIRPCEVVVFMRDVKSESYYEQMKGRGVRTVDDAQLRAVTPDARTKTRFVLVDAVGVTETAKTAAPPLERRRTVPFDRLLQLVAEGDRSEDTLTSLAARLAALDRKLEPDDARRAEEAAGASLRELANDLLDAVDPDVIERQAGEGASEAERDAVAERLAEDACAPFDVAPTRALLVDLKQRADIVIDDVNPDRVLSAGFDQERAQRTTESFEAFLAENRDRVTALQILYERPAGRQRLTYAQVRELADRLGDAPRYLTTADVWQAYKRLDAARVRGAPADRVLTEVVALVRFALKQADALEPTSVQAERRFNLWLGREKKAGRTYTDAQLAWLTAIRDHVAANAEVTRRDLMEAPGFTDRGGLIAARNLFGERLDALLTELRDAVAA